MVTMNIGGAGINSDFIMARNSITAPLHITMQLQSSVCRKIPFCIICGSHSSADEVSSLLVYYTELTGKEIMMCQSCILPTSEGKIVPLHATKE
jgi:hypothetical protein